MKIHNRLVSLYVFIIIFVSDANGFADKFLDEKERDVIVKILNCYTNFEGLPFSLEEIKAFPITNEVYSIIKRDTDWVKVLCVVGCDNDELNDIQAYAQCFNEKLNIAYTNIFYDIQNDQTISDELKKYKLFVSSISYLVQHYSIIILKTQSK